MGVKNPNEKMNFVPLSDMYIPPVFHTPPPVEGLTNNTDFPNLSSIEYRVKKPLTKQVNPQPFWDILEVDPLGQIVLVTNDYTSRTWNGSFFGYESFEHVGDPEKAVYSQQHNDLITNFKFVGPNIAIVSDSTGAVNLWSTRLEDKIRNSAIQALTSKRTTKVSTGDILKFVE